MFNGTIGQPLRSAEDYIFNDKALPNVANYESEPFKFGQVQSAVELVAEITAAASIPDTKNLKIELLHDAEKEGTYAESITLYDKTASGAAIDLAVGDELVKYVPNSDVKQWCKLKVTSDADLSAGKILAALELIAR